MSLELNPLNYPIQYPDFLISVAVIGCVRHWYLLNDVALIEHSSRYFSNLYYFDSTWKKRIDQ